MTGNGKENERQLDRLAEVFVEEILSTSDEEILVEAAEDYGDAKAAAGHVHDLINLAIVESGKSRLAAAKVAVRRSQTRPVSKVLDLPAAEKRAIIERFAANDNRLSEKFTLAARKGEELSERDLDGMLEALHTLGVIDEEGIPQ